MESIKIQKQTYFYVLCPHVYLDILVIKSSILILKMLYKEQRTLKYPSTLIER